jgi:hypothetical protein
MAFRTRLLALLGLSFLFVSGCSAKDAKVPAGPIEIYYTSVRGASRRVVDYFIIISAPAPSVAKSDSNREGVECFVG